VSLIAPDGQIYNRSLNTSLPLTGQVVYETTEVDPTTGTIVTINKPVVTLRRTSLGRIPIAGERWMVSIPKTPSPTAEMEMYTMDYPPKGGATIGFIKLYLKKVEQI